jgi:hypothetical protein
VQPTTPGHRAQVPTPAAQHSPGLGFGWCAAPVGARCARDALRYRAVLTRYGRSCPWGAFHVKRAHRRRPRARRSMSAGLRPAGLRQAWCSYPRPRRVAASARSRQPISSLPLAVDPVARPTGVRGRDQPAHPWIAPPGSSHSSQAGTAQRLLMRPCTRAPGRRHLHVLAWPRACAGARHSTATGARAPSASHHSPANLLLARSPACPLARLPARPLVCSSARPVARSLACRSPAFASTCRLLAH